MALNSSGEISLSGSLATTSIYKELEVYYKPSGGTLTASISLQDKWVAGLANKTTTEPISIPNDFYDKSKTILTAVISPTSISDACSNGSPAPNNPCSFVSETVSLTSRTGGITPFTYLWVFTGGNLEIYPTSPTETATTFATDDLGCGGSSVTATYVLRITPAIGSSYESNSVTITFTNNTVCPIQ
jgi:hypothetical protein